MSMGDAIHHGTKCQKVSLWHAKVFLAPKLKPKFSVCGGSHGAVVGKANANAFFWLVVFYKHWFFIFCVFFFWRLFEYFLANGFDSEKKLHFWDRLSNLLVIF